MEKIIHKVFPNLVANMHIDDWLTGRVILTPINIGVNAINAIVLASIPGDSIKFFSVDKVNDL